MKTLDLIAFDIGASNGRAVLGKFDGKRLSLNELHRFENGFITVGNELHWDIMNIFREMQRGFKAYAASGNKHLSAFGIDTWGVDYGLLDLDGKLLGNPRAYRSGTDNEMYEAWKVISKKDLFMRTGIAAMNFNTVYQLYRRKLENDKNLGRAHTLLLIPDLLGYLFTGDRTSEYTNATTTNLLNYQEKDWDYKTIKSLGIPERIFTPVDRAGTMRGKMFSSAAAELGIDPVPLAAVGTHDTASAVAAIPGRGSFAFCSSGTWSLFGMETDEAVLTDEVYDANFSNEGTVQGGYRLLKNIMGLWIIQECKRDWEACGKRLPWDSITEAAEKEKPLRSIIDPDYFLFFSAGDMENKIKTYCEKTSQPVPETIGQTARCIYESLALKYRWAMEKLENIKGARIDSLNIVGGGSVNGLLNRMTADSTGRRVTAGPSEGTCIGNLLMQVVALGELSGIDEAREVVRRSFKTEEYEPHHTQEWEDAYQRMIGYMEKSL